jgi:hypothetical protein
MRWPAHEDFWIGVNLPWLNYGGDFGANAWREDGGVGRPSERLILRDTLTRIAGEGFTRIRWFMLCDGRAGLRMAPDGSLEGLDEFVFRDADTAVEELGRAGLSAILVLFDYHWFRPATLVKGVQTCGRARLAADPRLRERLLERVVAPLLERYGRAPSILAWDVVNEPEWVTRGVRLAPRVSDVPRASMRDFIGDIVGLIHQRTSHAATVGSASARSLPLVEGLGLDVYQVHWYDRLDRKAPLDRSVASLGLDRPLVLGEFPTRGSRRMPVEIVEIARQNGYAGALAWSLLSGDAAADHQALVADLGRLRRA